MDVDRDPEGFLQRPHRPDVVKMSVSQQDCLGRQPLFGNAGEDPPPLCTGINHRSVPVPVGDQIAVCPHRAYRKSRYLHWAPPFFFI